MMQIRHTARALLGMSLGLWAGTGAAQDALDASQGRGAIQAMGRLGTDDGWALTDAALLVTGDGGATWSDLSPSRSMAGVRGVQFHDAARGFLIAIDAHERGGTSLTLLATSDGGRSWREQPIDGSRTGAAWAWSDARVEFVDDRHGFVLGRVATSAAFSRGHMFATQDGGATWARQPAPPSAEAFTFVDATRGFQLAADGARVFATFDGARTWSALALPEPRAGAQARYELPVFVAPQSGRLVRALDGRLTTFASDDGGSTWRPLAEQTTGEVEAVALAAGRVTAHAGAGLVALVGGERARRLRLAEPGAALSVRALSFSDAAHGWALVAEGTCQPQGCRTRTRLLALQADARGDAARTLLERDLALPGAAPGPEGSTISTGYGFDKCAAATTAQMQTWKTSSPFVDANVYFGGSARACPQTNLNAAWISAVFGQGWRLIPTWVGPQAPCSGLGTVFSTNATTARTQGLAEADAAANTAAALGITAGSPLYYDLENYNELDAVCTTAVRAFVNAWSERVKARGYLSGVYGAPADASHDWATGVIANPPDAVWIAQWVCSGGTSCTWTPSVFNLSGLSNTLWANNQRLRQYWGGHNETWGGTTFNIDRNYSQGPVATATGTTPYTFTCDNSQACFARFGPSQFWHTATTCGGAPLGQGGSMIWTYVNGTLTSNFARWTPTLNGAGNYTVSVFVPRCFGTTVQAKYKIVANGVTSFATVNQNAIFDQWVTLGTYAFAASGTQYVELADSTGEAASTLRQIAFDAVKFTK